MRRREFITLVGGAAVAWPMMARAQQDVKTLRVGAVSGQPRSASLWVAFEDRMAELGHLDGKNFAFDHVQVSSIEGFESGYGQITARNPDIIVASGPEISLKSALAAAKTQPIVMVAIDYDPFARGYVTNMARPGGNVTGVFLQQIELTVKRMQILKEGFPNMQAATVFWDQISADQWEAARNASAKVGLRLAGIELREQPYDYDRAFAENPPDYRGSLLVMASPFFFRDRARLADFALRNRIISFVFFRDMVEAGGLLSYGPSVTAMYRRAAEYVDRIARGTKPGELPIEQPTKFELVVNLRTAKAIGITIPTSILLRADEVVE
jgi:putative ABC transport system substrate-binding protein